MELLIYKLATLTAIKLFMSIVITLLPITDINFRYDMLVNMCTFVKLEEKNNNSNLLLSFLTY